MLIVSLTKANSKFEKEVKKFLFQIKSDLYVGHATRRVFDFLAETAKITILDDNVVKLCFQNANAPAGFEILEIANGDIKKCEILDWIFIA